jgi:hypothetical protein
LDHRPPSNPSLTVERLVHFLVEDDGDPLADELAAWLSASARFRVFADLHRKKIRKKLRGATDAGARLDVRAELAVARLLLADRSVELAFEAYGSQRLGPDFTVTRGSHRFNVEVTRLRVDPAKAGFGALLAKMRQLPPAIPNVVILAIEGDDSRAYVVGEVVRTLRARADRKDDALFTGRGFSGTRGFYERFLRLGSVIVWAEAGRGEARASAWTNPSARSPVPLRELRAMLGLLRGSE